MRAATDLPRRTLARRLLGLLLLLVALALATWTERDVASYDQALTSHGAPVQSPLPSDVPVGGGLVRVSGMPASSAAVDREFGLSVAAPVLWRTVEMFQWREVEVGGIVHYEIDWVDHPVASARFRTPAGHANPGAFPIQSARFAADRVSIDGQRLDDALVAALPGRVPVRPDMHTLPANLAASFTLHDDTLITSSHPNSPQLGDVRVSWEKMSLQPVTLLVRASQGHLSPAASSSIAIENQVQVGQRSLSELLPDLPAAPALPWLRRVAALLLAVVGLACLLWSSRRDGVVALATGLGLILVGAIGVVSWLDVDVTWVIGWLAIALAGFAAAVWQLRGSG